MKHEEEATNGSARQDCRWMSKSKGSHSLSVFDLSFLSLLRVVGESRLYNNDNRHFTPFNSFPNRDPFIYMIL